MSLLKTYLPRFMDFYSLRISYIIFLLYSFPPSISVLTQHHVLFLALKNKLTTTTTNRKQIKIIKIMEFIFFFFWPPINYLWAWGLPWVDIPRFWHLFLIQDWSQISGSSLLSWQITVCRHSYIFVKHTGCLPGAFCYNLHVFVSAVQCTVKILC